MTAPPEDRVVRVLLDGYGRTYAQELGIDLAKGTPSPLFRWLCAAILFSARISAGIAAEAVRSLAARGWTTPARMAGSTWEQRAETLNRAGYARYDERTATMLGEVASMLLERYGGDLRGLREEAGRDPSRERRLLKRFKGLGDVGVGIFCREAQGPWEELYPFADRRALAAAGKLGLDTDARALARHSEPKDFPRLIAALVRVELAGDIDEVLKRAGA